MVALSVGCSSSATPKAELDGACTTNSDCIDGLVCGAGHCLRPCKTASDCPAAACVNAGGDVYICQL